MVTKGGQAEISFAAGAKTATRGTHHLAGGKEPVEEIEGFFAFGELPPNIGSVFAAKNRVTGSRQFLTDELGRIHIALDDFRGFFPALGCINGFGSSLGHVVHAVELGALATVPHGMELGKFIESNAADYSSIELCGLVSNICVVSNAVIAKAAAPEAEIIVDSKLTASFDPKLGEEVFDILKGIQVTVL